MCTLQLRQFFPVCPGNKNKCGRHPSSNRQPKTKNESQLSVDRPLDPREQSQWSTTTPALPAEMHPLHRAKPARWSLGAADHPWSASPAPVNRGSQMRVLQPGPSSSRGAAAPGRVRSHSAAAPSQARIARVCRVDSLLAALPCAWLLSLPAIPRGLAQCPSSPGT